MSFSFLLFSSCLLFCDTSEITGNVKKFNENEKMKWTFFPTLNEWVTRKETRNLFFSALHFKNKWATVGDTFLNKGEDNYDGDETHKLKRKRKVYRSKDGTKKCAKTLFKVTCNPTHLAIGLIHTEKWDIFPGFTCSYHIILLV